MHSQNTKKQKTEDTVRSKMFGWAAQIIIELKTFRARFMVRFWKISILPENYFEKPQNNRISTSLTQTVLNPPYKCTKPDCTQTFINCSSLARHVTVDHNHVRFHCPEEGCGGSFKQMHHLKRHIRNMHTDERPYPCHLCEKRFKDTYRLVFEISYFLVKNPGFWVKKCHFRVLKGILRSFCGQKRSF